MKKTLALSLFVLLNLNFSLQAFAKAKSIPVVPGWTFHEPTMSNPFFNFKDESFQGTLVKRGQDKPIPSIIVVASKKPKKLTTSLQTQNWLNTKYFKNKAKVIDTLDLTKNNKLFVYKLKRQNRLKIIFLYTYSKNGQIYILSQESNTESYKEDLRLTLPNIKRLKFI